MGLKFEEIRDLNSTSRHNGFDPEKPYDWLMVPLNERKDVALWDAENMTVTAADPSIAEVVGNVPLIGGPSNRRLTILGKRKGRTFIEVKKNGAVKTKLEVSVKEPIKKTVAFWFVADAPNADGAAYVTDRNPSEAPLILAQINAIFKPQTNVEFVSVGAEEKQLSKSLGDEIDASGHTIDPILGDSEWDSILALKDRTADLHVFFVWAISCQKGKRRIDCIGVNGGEDSLVEDTAKGVQGAAETAAHEIGHAFGLPDLKGGKKRDLLMYFEDQGGTRISKTEANIVNGPF